MQFVDSFEVTKIGKAYVVKVNELHPKRKTMLFHVDSGASVTLVGLNSFCNKEDIGNYNLLKSIIEERIQADGLDKYVYSAKTATEEQVETYPCKCDGVSISETKPITLFFHIYLGNVGMPLLGFDYIDDTSYHHTIAGDLIVTGVAEDIGKRFYPEKVLDFNSILEDYKSRALG